MERERPRAKAEHGSHSGKQGRNLELGPEQSSIDTSNDSQTKTHRILLPVTYARSGQTGGEHGPRDKDSALSIIAASMPRCDGEIRFGMMRFGLGDPSGPQV